MTGIEQILQTTGRGITDFQAERIRSAGQELRFQDLLAEKMNGREEIRVSRHASVRMEERGVVMSEELKSELSAAMDTAERKGARNALLIGDRNYYIVNIPNRTIVTAVTKDEMKENVFTNIDSAVLI